jgi:hypothetical protein
MLANASLIPDSAREGEIYEDIGTEKLGCRHHGRVMILLQSNKTIPLKTDDTFKDL